MKHCGIFNTYERYQLVLNASHGLANTHTRTIHGSKTAEVHVELCNRKAKSYKQ